MNRSNTNCTTYIKKKQNYMIYKCYIISLLKRALKKTTIKDLIELLKKAIMYMTLGIDVSILFVNILYYVITP